MFQKTGSESSLSPEPEVWRECLELCDRIASNEAYSALQEHGMLAIDDPDLGDRIYCSVPPPSGDAAFRLVFITQGDDAWLRFLSALHAASEDPSVEALFSACDGVVVLLKEWKDTPEFVREEYKRLGYTRKKGERVPLLFSVRAGWLPSGIYREDVDILKRGIEQCLSVVRSPWGTMGASRAPHNSQPALFRVRVAEEGPDGGRRWVDRWEHVPDWLDTGLTEVQDEGEVDRLAGELTRREGAVWEAEAFYVQASMPAPPSHSDIARHFKFKLPRCLAVMERTKDVPRFVGLDKVLLEDLGERLQLRLLEALERAEYIPQEIHTVRGDIYRALKKLCVRLGVRLYLAETLVHGEWFRDEVSHAMQYTMQEMIKEIVDAPEGVPLGEYLADAARKKEGHEPPPSDKKSEA